MAAKKGVQSKPIEMFESALKYFWGEKYEQAKKAFEKIVGEYPEEYVLVERINAFINVCDERLSQEFKPSTADELYAAGVFHLNRNECKESVAYLRRAIKKDEHNDSYLFTLACALARCGESDEALDTIKQAVKLNANNRIFARTCGDFKALAEDKRFKQLTD
jgi:tetratricopeptide (TPR) repeat protein